MAAENRGINSPVTSKRPCQWGKGESGESTKGFVIYLLCSVKYVENEMKSRPKGTYLTILVK
jgi:hypothetical protein